MKKRHIGFSKILQFRNVVHNVSNRAHFVGFDTDGEPIYNSNMAKPILVFDGTVKLHGTNGSVSLSDNDELWFQSRRKILSIDADNQGFWQFCTDRTEIFRKLMKEIVVRTFLNNGNPGIISIFGEYCGQGIANGTAISKLPRMFVIFAVKVTPSNDDADSYYIDSKNLSSPDDQIYNINDFTTYNISIDFNYPELSQNKFVKLVNAVECECPVGKKLGVEGIGEGIVWTGYYDHVRHVFKTKGAKHSISKVKTVAPVNVEKLNSIKEFVDYAITENRLQQAVTEVFGDSEPTIKKMRDFLRWIMNDVKEEEADVLSKNSLILKDVGRSISNKARPWFQDLINRNVGLS